MSTAFLSRAAPTAPATAFGSLGVLVFAGSTGPGLRVVLVFAGSTGPRLRVVLAGSTGPGLRVVVAMQIVFRVEMVRHDVPRHR